MDSYVRIKAIAVPALSNISCGTFSYLCMFRHELYKGDRTVV